MRENIFHGEKKFEFAVGERGLEAWTVKVLI